MNPESLKIPLSQEVISETPEVLLEAPEELDNLLEHLINEYKELESRVHPHPEIREDTDIVVVFSGPGAISKNIPPYTDKPDSYKNFPWSRKMDRGRVRVAEQIVREVTGIRIGKKASEVTQEDIINIGPYLHYSGTPWENDHFMEAIKSGEINIPKEKIFSYSEIEDPSGNIRTIARTSDQISGLKFPETPRRIVIVDQSAHLVRVLHMMGMFSDRIPKGAVVQPFPIPISDEGEFEFAKMELRGTVAYIYKHGLASKEPFPYEKIITS